MGEHGKWTTSDIPPQDGRIAVVTGSTDGVGYEMALALAKSGAEVVVAGRSEEKGKNALNNILKNAPTAKASFEPVNLADLSSVQAFGERMNSRYERIDILINNAGVMTPPKRLLTKDGFELQFGTNYLGHFALTSYLMPLLKNGDKPRIVTLTTLSPGTGKIDFDDLQSERKYRPMPAYIQSKLACVMFALELQRLSDAEGWGIMSNLAHPGLASTGLLSDGKAGSLFPLLFKLFPGLRQSADMGALPALFAAASPDARKAACYAPDGIGHTKGCPMEIAIGEKAKDIKRNTRLWEISESLTRTKFIKGKIE